jgi:hypothetical protein
LGYYVIAQDGNRYGPADIPTLQQWVREGRIAPNTTLEDEVTGTHSGDSRRACCQSGRRAGAELNRLDLFQANQIRGWLLPPAAGEPAPSGGGASGQATALVLGLGLVCCGLLGIGWASRILG